MGTPNDLVDGLLTKLVPVEQDIKAHADAKGDGDKERNVTPHLIAVGQHHKAMDVFPSLLFEDDEKFDRRKRHPKVLLLFLRLPVKTNNTGILQPQ
jgi:hypothetical protein